MQMMSDTRSPPLPFPQMSKLPPEAERRRRLVTRAAATRLIALVAFIVGAIAGAPGSPEQEAAKRFADAWERGEFAAMYRELNPASQREIGLERLRPRLPRSRRDARRARARRRLGRRRPAASGGGRRRAGAGHGSHRGLRRRRGRARAALRRRRHRLGREPRLPRAAHRASTWKARSSSRRGRRSSPPTARRSPRARPKPAPIPLGSAAIDVTGEVGTAEEDGTAGARPPGLPARHPGRRQRPRAGLQRPARRQAGRLAAGRRRRRRLGRGSSPRPNPEPGAPVKTTIDPGLQESAVCGPRRAASAASPCSTPATATSAPSPARPSRRPQPPGSTFKTITTTAALQKGVVSLDDEFEITNGVNVGGRFIENANGEYCGGTFREAFAESCNADFAPLGPKIGNDELVGDGRTVRLQLAADPLRPADRRRSRTGRIDDPDRDRRRSRPRGQRDRPGRSAGDPAGDGERRPDDRQRRRARADLDRRQPEAAPRRRSRCG